MRTINLFSIISATTLYIGIKIENEAKNRGNEEYNCMLCYVVLYIVLHCTTQHGHFILIVYDRKFENSYGDLEPYE